MATIDGVLIVKNILSDNYTAIISIATGEKSPNCSEEDCINPAADNYISPESIYNLCSEEAVSMTFQKGHIPWIKGRKLSEKEKEKLKAKAPRGKLHSNYGKHWPEEMRARISATLTGNKLSEETKKKISMANHGKKRSESTREKLRKPKSEEHKRKISEAHKGLRKGCIPWNKGVKRTDILGEKNGRWNGGISYLPYCPKFDEKLKERIRERDNRTCQLCGTKEDGKKLDVHHIHYDKPNCDPDLIALCRKCNSKVNGNRDYYEELFVKILEQRGLLCQQ